MDLPGGDQRGSVREEGSLTESIFFFVGCGRKQRERERRKTVGGELWNLWNPDISVVFTRIRFGLSRPIHDVYTNHFIILALHFISFCYIIAFIKHTCNFVFFVCLFNTIENLMV